MSRKYKAIFIILFLALLIAAAASFLVDLKSVQAKVEEGNRLFFDGNYEGAEKWYREAQVEDPSSTRIGLNLGNVLYRQGKYQEAVSEYNKAPQTDQRVLDSVRHYNIGNSLFRQNMLKEALESYKKALDLTPDDEDAKFNIEIVQERLDQIEGVYGKSLELITEGKVNRALSLVTTVLKENPRAASFLSEHKKRLEIIANVIQTPRAKSVM